MRILLTFAGFHDPYSKSLIDGEEHPGPVLTVAAEMAFDWVVLFSTPRTIGQVRDTQKALRERHAGLVVKTIDLALTDPTDYASILTDLRRHGRAVREEQPDAQLFISTASGTPQMHACWLLLAASGELPARLLHSRPPQFITADKPAISEVDVSAQGFPIIRPARLGQWEPAEPADCARLKRALDELGIVAVHPRTVEAVERAAAIAPFQVPTLVLGETGTGKELIAALIHRLSGLPAERFVPVNCGAIPHDLVESTLFGHKKGAFTGATSDLIGKFEAADKGTLFLDEIGDLPASAQAKLLRVLEDGKVEPVGSHRSKKVDVRVIAATNRNLAAEAESGRFRKDLYYRLNPTQIHLAPLRERRTEIIPLALHLLDEINNRFRRPRRIRQDALAKLGNHDWPGNVRELRNVLQRAVIFSGNRETLGPDDVVLEEEHRAGASFFPEPRDGFRLDDHLESVRAGLLSRALEIAEGNQTRAAKLLGITPQAVNNFCRKKGRS